MFLIETLSYSDKSNKYFFTEHITPGHPDRTLAPVAPASREGPRHSVSRARFVSHAHIVAPPPHPRAYRGPSMCNTKIYFYNI